MLTSLCVSFRKLLWAFVASFVQLNTVWVAGAQFSDSVHQEKKLYDELLLRRLGVQTKWHQRVSWVVGAVTCGVHSISLSIPTSWVCIVRACCMLAVAPAGLLWYKREQTHSTAADMRGVGFLKHWHFPVTAGLEGMVAADCWCCCCSCCLWFSREEYRK